MSVFNHSMNLIRMHPLSTPRSSPTQILSLYHNLRDLALVNDVLRQLSAIPRLLVAYVITAFVVTIHAHSPPMPSQCGTYLSCLWPCISLRPFVFSTLMVLAGLQERHPMCKIPIQQSLKRYQRIPWKPMADHGKPEWLYMWPCITVCHWHMQQRPVS